MPIRTVRNKHEELVEELRRSPALLVQRTMLRNIGEQAATRVAASCFPLLAAWGVRAIARRRWPWRSFPALPMLGLLGSFFLMRGSARVHISGYLQARALFDARLSMLAANGLAALNVVQSASADSPFVFVLRNFAPEALGAEVEHPSGYTQRGRVLSRLLGRQYAQQVITAGVNTHYYAQSVEETLAAELRGRAAVVTVANLHNLMIPQPQENIFGLIVTRPDWETPLRLVAATSAVIIITADYATPGLAQELEMVRRLGLEQKTIVLVPRDARGPELRHASAALAMAGATAPRYEPMRPDNEMLSGFRVVVTGDLSSSGLAEDLGLGGMLDDWAESSASVTASARGAALYQRAQQEIAEHLYVTAVDTLMESLPIWRECHDLYRVAETMISLGLLTSSEDTARALMFYREALDVMPQLTPAERRSLLAAYHIGFVSVLNHLGTDEDRIRLRALLLSATRRHLFALCSQGSGSRSCSLK